jgi:transcriptional regulator with XRE-family HTH domain
VTKLQRVRIERRLTRAQLSDQSGVSYGSIRRHEEGEGEMGEANLFKLAGFFKVSPFELQGDVPDVEPSAGRAA